MSLFQTGVESNLRTESTAKQAESLLPTPSLVSLQKITKNYSLGEQTVEALRGVSLEVPRSQFVVIMGASGSGKSTLLNLVGCLDRPTAGTYLLDGLDVSNLSSPQRADIRNLKVGFVFQNFNLLPRTTVWENVEAPMLYAGVPKDEREHRTRDTLEIVGIPEKARALPNQLSGGQQQRVAVARALVNRPPLLLADEPTGNLDSGTSREIMDFLQSLNSERGLTLMLVTHERDIAAYASRVIHMQDGLVQQDVVNS